MPRPGRAPRNTLTRELVLATAIELADADGLAKLTIRALAERLSVKPMAIYHHFDGKGAILDGMVDIVFAQIVTPVPGHDWFEQITARSRSLRTVLLRHAWALGLLESRSSPGPDSLAHLDALMGTLRHAGFSLAQVATAVPLIDSYVYGFVLQELALPFAGPDETQEIAEAFEQSLPADTYPHLFEFLMGHVMVPGYDFSEEFERGLQLTLAAVARMIDDPRANG